MKKQGILKIFAGMILIATTTACGSSSAGVKNVDLKDQKTPLQNTSGRVILKEKRECHTRTRMNPKCRLQY